MKIALGSDHRGDAAVKVLIPALRAAGHDANLLGDCNGQPCDYPDKAWLVAKAVSGGQAEFGILVCGSGIGVTIAANKVAGVRAALVFDEVAAGMCRSHNNANVLCMSGDTTPAKTMTKIVEIWLSTPFEGGRHERRVRKIEAIERGMNPNELAIGSGSA
jgi:ribose 5-phosphate isomerase B